MSVTTSSNRVSYISTGGTTFAYPFKILDDDHLEVYKDGVLQSSGYSVTGAGDANGGNVVFSSAVTLGVEVLLIRVVPVTQLITIPGGLSKFPAESTEDGLDKLTMIVQQQAEELNRSITWPLTTPSTVSNELPDPTAAANKGGALVIAGDGLSIETHPITGGGDIDVLTTAGDMVYFTGSSAARLGRGGLFYHLGMDPNTNLPNWRPPSVIRVADFFTPDGANDDYANLQALFNTYQTGDPMVFEFEQGKVYNISQSLVIRKDVILKGNGCTIQALSGGWVGTAAANTGSLIRNYNHGYNNIPAVVSSFLDENIKITDFRFSYNGESLPGEASICLFMRYVDKVIVEDCYFNDCRNATGFLACRDTYINRCHAEEARNCAFDHWDGASNATVTNCTVKNSVDCAQGIQFTGTGSLFENRDSINAVVAFNRLYGIRNSSTNVASAIISNANDADSATYRFMSIHNYIENSDLGVVFAGAGGYHTSYGDVLNLVDQVPLFMQATDSDSPAKCAFIDSFLIDCETSGNGLVNLTGVQPVVRGLRIHNNITVTYPYIVQVYSTATDAVVDISTIKPAADGTSGRILDNGTTTRVYNESRTYTPVLSFGGATTGITYTSRLGTYTRYGDVIHARGTIVVNDNGSASGGAAISLPTAASSVQLNGVMTCWLTGASGLTSNVIGLVTTDGTVAALYDTGATGSVIIDENNIPNSCTISYDVTYRAAL